MLSDILSAYVFPLSSLLLVTASALALIRVHCVLRREPAAPAAGTIGGAAGRASPAAAQAGGAAAQAGGAEAQAGGAAGGAGLEARVAELKALCEATQSGQTRLAELIAAMQEEMNAWNRLERLVVEPAPAARRASTMELAARLARDGASIDELKSSFGLSLGEASLLQRLHGGGVAA